MSAAPSPLRGGAALAAALRPLASAVSRPLIVALDGRSGSGKSTLAASLAHHLDAAIVEGDDFYAGGTALRGEDPAALAAACIDWTRQRDVLAALREDRAACWRAFDWEAFDGRLRDEPRLLTPKPIVILEGVYSGRRELRDLVDAAVLVSIGDADREARLLAREGVIGPWERQWHAAEAHYFAQDATPGRFDLHVEGTAI